MQPDMNSMMREQLYTDGYVLCYSGMKTRRSTLDPIGIALTKRGLLFFINEGGGVFVNAQTNMPGYSQSLLPYCVPHRK